MQPQTIQQQVAAALSAVAAAPTSREPHVAFFELLELILTNAGIDAAGHVLGLWFDVCMPGGTRLEAVDRLAAACRDTRIARFAAIVMIRTGFPEESVRAFGHGCLTVPGGPSTLDWRAGIVEKFSAIAADYDESLSQRLTADQFGKFLSETAPIRPRMQALDVGCGTGLVGEWLKPQVALLDGIDLSPEMIAQARAKGIYDSLVLGEACEEMARPDRRRRYDLVLCSWCLFYMPDLTNFFRAAAAALAPAGRLALSVYPCTDDHDVLRKDEDMEYAHSRRYLRRLADENGLTEERIETRLLCIHPGFYAVFSIP